MNTQAIETCLDDLRATTIQLDLASPEDALLALIEKRGAAARLWSAAGLGLEAHEGGRS
jgi:hypothetical protein